MKRFWNWYERNYVLNVSVAAFLFLLQLVHLVWLFGDVIWFKLFSQALFPIGKLFQTLLILVDYTEIPALVGVSMVYIYELRKGFKFKPFLFLLFLNIQWLHLFWITDEFVIQAFRHAAVSSVWLAPHKASGFYAGLAWVAILIDYLEVPVIIETFKKFFTALKNKQTKEFLVNGFKG